MRPRIPASTTYGGLPGDVSAGDPILIDDGRVRLQVLAIRYQPEAAGEYHR